MQENKNGEPGRWALLPVLQTDTRTLRRCIRSGGRVGHLHVIEAKIRPANRIAAYVTQGAISQ